MSERKQIVVDIEVDGRYCGSTCPRLDDLSGNCSLSEENLQQDVDEECPHCGQEMPRAELLYYRTRYCLEACPVRK